MSNDWVEGVRVEYDDEELSYTQLLDVFFKMQVPVKRSQQYGLFVFPHNDEQEWCTHAWLDENWGHVCADGISVDMIQVEPSWNDSMKLTCRMTQATYNVTKECECHL